MKSIIEVKHISKAFKIGGNAGYLSFRESISQALSFRSKKQTFLALDDVSFQVEKGERLGIIGKNGAGKSTLLKILSKITYPTSGEVVMRGRVASLLEVGTGFHPELTGMENIFLNGSILGMKRAEILSKRDEIISFSGIEPFLGTPLKHYSSGMRLRLAFAVAAHLEPEILLIDEVLAVGDAEFQKKCLGKMKDISQSGRTIIFVSHDLGAVERLCPNSILLEKGKLVYEGKTADVKEKYLAGFNSTAWSNQQGIDKIVSIEGATIRLEGKQPNHELVISCEIVSQQDLPDGFLAFDIKSENQVCILQAAPKETPYIPIKQNQSTQISCRIRLDGLIPMRYFVTAWIGPSYNETYDLAEDILSFEILDSPVIGRTMPHFIEHGHLVAPSQLEEMTHSPKKKNNDG